MPRGCISCMRGSTLMETLLLLIAVMGMGLILLGLIFYNKDILEFKMDVSKDDLTTYVGYSFIFLGTLLIFMSVLTWNRI
jgi:hypothetical protein